MAVVLTLAGFGVRSFANLAIDAMSLFVIESKGWIVFLLGQGILIWLIRRRRDRVPHDTTIRRLLKEARAGEACPVQIVIRQWGVVMGPTRDSRGPTVTASFSKGHARLSIHAAQISPPGCFGAKASAREA